MPVLTVEQISGILDDFWRRAELIRLAGGIAAFEVIDGQKTVPQGWVQDYWTDYWVPPDLCLETKVQ